MGKKCPGDGERITLRVLFPNPPTHVPSWLANPEPGAEGGPDMFSPLSDLPWEVALASGRETENSQGTGMTLYPRGQNYGKAHGPPLSLQSDALELGRKYHL